MTISRKFYNILKWLLFTVAVFIVLLAMSAILYLYFDKKHEGKFFPGTIVAGIDISGLIKEDAESKLNQKIDEIQGSGIEFAYYNEKATMDTVLTSTGADIAWPVILFDIDKALDAAYAYPRTSSWLYNIEKRMELWNTGRDFDINLILKKDSIMDFLDDKFAHFSTPAKDASLVSTSTPYEKQIEFGVSNEIYGQSLDYSKAMVSLSENLSNLSDAVIFLEASVEYPEVYKKDCFNISTKAEDIVEQAPLSLSYEDEVWEIDRTELIALLKLKKGSDEEKVIVGLDEEKTIAYLVDVIAVEINEEAVDAKFEIIDGKVEQFQVNKDGIEMETKKTFDILEKKLLTKSDEEVVVVSKITESKSSTEEMEDLGIKEILGTGHSKFSGSPSNRRHNIAIGAASVNGSLVPPGEEFSLMGVLGAIDGESGYKQELVIKEGKTIPEYGGGLCQIGTTVFRATVNTGLPVTMRRNHSYRVSYYEPAGTDATIYDPWPDYKFKNDTEKHVLIQARIEGDDLYFDFWGTPDGRKASSTYPIIYNIKKPGPTKMIETLDLEPGVKRCTESAHNGADAYFDYGVEYPDGNLVETRFKSHYVPWQAVCLIGVEALSTSTPETIID